jgi:hypothetical protein
MGKNALSSTSPPSRSRQGRGPSGPGRRRPAAPRGKRRPEIGGNGEEGKGIRFPLPDLGCDGVQGRLGGGGRREVVPAYGRGVGEVKREREVVAKVRGEVGSRAGPFYRRGKVGLGENF